ncbi:unnamed protein product [Larinioides sclopetarius]|uniref:Uncharacterized protein n=1 Tax=Larinioides sclopetarius TaxID=280406 RepID=A0AAV1ZE77_9ARAC
MYHSHGALLVIEGLPLHLKAKQEVTYVRVTKLGKVNHLKGQNFDPLDFEGKISTVKFHATSFNLEEPVFFDHTFDIDKPIKIYTDGYKVEDRIGCALTVRENNIFISQWMVNSNFTIQFPKLNLLPSGKLTPGLVISINSSKSVLTANAASSLKTNNPLFQRSSIKLACRTCRQWNNGFPLKESHFGRDPNRLSGTQDLPEILRVVASSLFDPICIGTETNKYLFRDRRGKEFTADACSDNPGSYAGGSLITGRVFKNTDTKGALGGTFQVVLFLCFIFEISKTVRGADGIEASQAPALAKVSAISLPSRSTWEGIHCRCVL